MTGLLALLLVTTRVASATVGAADTAAPARPPAAVEHPTPPPPARPREIYDVHLAVDVPVTIVAASAGLVRILFEDQLARKSCPCDSRGINPIDRGAVGNHSGAAGIAANVTVYAVI